MPSEEKTSSNLKKLIIAKREYTAAQTQLAHNVKSREIINDFNNHGVIVHMLPSNRLDSVEDFWSQRLKHVNENINQKSFLSEYGENNLMNGFQEVSNISATLIRGGKDSKLCKLWNANRNKLNCGLIFNNNSPGMQILAAYRSDGLTYNRPIIDQEQLHHKMTKHGISLNQALERYKDKGFIIKNDKDLEANFIGDRKLTNLDISTQQDTLNRITEIAKQLPSTAEEHNEIVIAYPQDAIKNGAVIGIIVDANNMTKDEIVNMQNWEEIKSFANSSALPILRLKGSSLLPINTLTE